MRFFNIRSYQELKVEKNYMEIIPVENFNLSYLNLLTGEMQSIQLMFLYSILLIFFENDMNMKMC